MPFTAYELQEAGKAALDYYVKNNLVDQVNTERPLYKKLKAKAKTAPGNKENIVEQIRKSNSANFQWFNGSKIVTYNKRYNIEQPKYPWRSAHDGFALEEDRMIQNGIQVTDSGPGGNFSQTEYSQLTNLLKEETEALGLGFEEKFDQALHLDGSSDVDAITGLDALISLTPTVGVVGGLDAATEVYWRNGVATGLTVTPTTGTILDQLEVLWRVAIRNGGHPDFLLVGSDFLDGYRNFMLKTYGRVNYGATELKSVDGGSPHVQGVSTGIFFKGVEMIWDPVFAELDALYAPGTPWEKRCYGINTRHLTLRPLQGQDMITRKPPRAYNKYEYYWGMTWRGGLTTNRRNAHFVAAIA